MNLSLGCSCNSVEHDTCQSRKLWAFRKAKQIKTATGLVCLQRSRACSPPDFRRLPPRQSAQGLRASDRRNLTEDTVAMEIELRVISRLEEAVTLFRENASNPANRRQLVRLHIAPELAQIILDATLGSIECISERDSQDVGCPPADREVRAGHLESSCRC